MFGVHISAKSPVCGVVGPAATALANFSLRYASLGGHANVAASLGRLLDRVRCQAALTGEVDPAEHAAGAESLGSAAQFPLN